MSGVVQMRFYAEPMVTGGQRAYLSEMIPVQPGDQVEGGDGAFCVTDGFL